MPLRKILGIILLFVFGASLIFYSHYYLEQKKYQKNFEELKDHQKTQISLGVNKLWIEVVNTELSRRQGLSERVEIGSDGMLFVFEEKQKLQFWMKEMNFDIDIVWLADGQVLEVTENVKSLKTSVKTDQLQLYSPQHLADMALELTAGEVQKLSIKVGDKIEIIKY
jgi:uncharacterized protein